MFSLGGHRVPFGSRFIALSILPGLRRSVARYSCAVIVSALPKAVQSQARVTRVGQARLNAFGPTRLETPDRGQRPSSRLGPVISLEQEAPVAHTVMEGAMTKVGL
jgi:hypothetical protein